MEPNPAALSSLVYAVAVGLLLVGLARRLRMPAIVLLLGGGILLGPYGAGLILPESLGASLGLIIKCAVAIILFEGGLSLDWAGYKRSPVVIRRLLTTGALVTWLGTALVIYAVFRFDPLLCLLAGSLVIVTGPTVIIPILKRIRLNERLHHILHWEGVLIDAVGVFLAVTCYELVTGHTSGGYAVASLAMRITAGVVIGLLVGALAAAAIRAGWVPNDLRNPAALGAGLLTLGLCEQVAHESGLLGVVVAGFVLAARLPVDAPSIRHFKEQLSDLLIGVLFMLLAANLDIRRFVEYGWPLAAAVGMVMLLVRPAGVFLCAHGRSLSMQERLVLSWIAPRGIVAASTASLFAITLSAKGDPHAGFLEVFTYSVIVATVVVQGFTAGWVARLLGVTRSEPRGWLIVGAHRLSKDFARMLAAADIPCVMVDTSARAVRECGGEVACLRDDALDPNLPLRLAEHGIGHVLAVTDNEDLNALVCQAWAEQVGPNNVYRWTSGTGATERAAMRHGTIVWAAVPKPSVASFELERGISRLESRGAEEQLPSQTALGTIADGMFRVSADGTRAAAGDRGITIFLHRDENLLAQCLDHRLFVRTDEPELEPLISRLVRACSEYHPDLNAESCTAEVLERERLFETSIGNGFAVPHAYWKALKTHVCAVGIVPAGLAMNTPDGQPVRVVVMVLSPTGDPEGHLTIMAQVAHLASTPRAADALMGATTGFEMDRILRDLISSRGQGPAATGQRTAPTGRKTK